MKALGMAKGKWEGIAMGAAALAGLCAGLASAQPAPDPIVDRHWARFVGGRQLDPAQHPQHRGALAAWNTADSVFLLPFDYNMCLIACGDCGFLGRKPRAFALPFRSLHRKPVPFALVHQTGAKVYPEGGAVSATAVFLLPDRRLFRLNLAWNESGATTQEKWEIETLAQPQYEKPIEPQAIIPAADMGGEEEHAFIVIGKDGYGSIVDWRDTAKLVERPRNTPISDFTAQTGRFVGTASGEIYAFNSSMDLILQGKPFHGPVTAVDFSGAVGPGGAFAYSHGPRWVVDSAARGIHPHSWWLEWDASGLRGSFWNAATKPAVAQSTNAAPLSIRMTDSPTRIHTLLPSTLAAALNQETQRVGYPPNFVIHATISDSDGNYDAPIIRRIRNADTLLITAGLVKTVPGWGEGKWPLREVGCAADGGCLRGEAVDASFLFGSDSLLITLPALFGKMDPACSNQPYFRVSHHGFRLGADLKPNDVFEFRFGKDAFSVMLQTSMSLAQGNGRRLREIRGPAFDAAGRNRVLRAGVSGVKGQSPATPRFQR